MRARARVSSLHLYLLLCDAGVNVLLELVVLHASKFGLIHDDEHPIFVALGNNIVMFTKPSEGPSNKRGNIAGSATGCRDLFVGVFQVDVNLLSEHIAEAMSFKRYLSSELLRRALDERSGCGNIRFVFDEVSPPLYSSAEMFSGGTNDAGIDVLVSAEEVLAGARAERE